MSDESPVLLVLPKLGQTMEKGTIVRWEVADGGHVDEGQTIVSVETDKATYDLESPGTGTLHILVPQGEEVAVETPLASIGGAATPSGTALSPVEKGTSSPGPSSAVQPAEPPRERTAASPRARRLATELGVDLRSVTPSGQDGIISSSDVRAAAEHRQEPSPQPAGQRPRRVPAGRELLSGLRRTTARRMQEAWQTIPHIVQIVDADASGLLAERASLRESGIEVTVNELLIQAVARAVVAAPVINVALDGEEIVRFEGVDVGFAVETGRGLAVPVLRRAETLSIGELVREARRLANAAKTAGLRSDEIGDASVTVSNLGMHGVRTGTPIINPGEPALVFVGAIEDRVVAVEGSAVVRPMLTLSIAYDHRIVDGVQAAQFTRAAKAAIESYGQHDR